MSYVPTTDADWETLFASVKGMLPERPLSLPPIPLGVPRMIDHTLLKLDADQKQVDKLCDEAKEHGFVAVCVRLEHVERAVANLEDAPTTVVACVVGFHEGTTDTHAKAAEAKAAIAQGARELDMVINYPLLKEGKYMKVYEDILAVRREAPRPVILKAILETSELDRDELIAAVILSCKAEVDFVKTSTGFSRSGASVKDVTLMRLVSDLVCGTDNCKVKASGGIRSIDDCMRFIKAGATRIGTSSGVKIVREFEEGEVLEQGAGHAVI